MDVHGALLAQGTATSPITFTSAQLTPSPGYWKWIRFDPESAGSLLSNAIVEYGGNDPSGDRGMIIVEDSSVAVANIAARQSSKTALYISNSRSTIQNSSFTNSQFGLKLYGGSYPTLGSEISFQNNSVKDVFIDDTGQCESVVASYTESASTNCP